MSCSHFIEQSDWHMVAGTLIHKSQLFLHFFRTMVPVIISTPDLLHAEILKAMTNQFSAGFSNIPFSPVFFSDQKSEFTLIVLFRQIRVPIQFKFDLTNCLVCLSITNSITLWCHKNILNDKQAFFFIFMRAPAA